MDRATIKRLDAEKINPAVGIQVLLPNNFEMAPKITHIKLIDTIKTVPAILCTKIISPMPEQIKSIEKRPKAKVITARQFAGGDVYIIGG